MKKEENITKVARRRGRPAGRTKSVVSLSLDTDIVTMLKATGPGWQTRVNELLRSVFEILLHEKT